MHCNEEENVLFIDILDLRYNGAPIDLVATRDSRCLSNKIEIQSVEDRTDLNLKFVSMLMQMQRNDDDDNNRSALKVIDSKQMHGHACLNGMKVKID